MKASRSYIALIVIIQILFMPGVNGVTLSISAGGDDHGVVGSSTKFSAPDDAEVKSSAVLSFDKSASLSQVISGSGELTDSRWTKNSAGAYVEVGVDIRNSDSYVYSYNLNPGEGTWRACKHPEVSASEYLDVINANYINAYALARSANGYEAIARTEISDSKKEATLRGYKNKAVARYDKVSATQSADDVIGVVSPSASAVDKSSKSSKEAKTEVSFVGDYKIEQSASIDRSTIKASQSLNGVGYLTSASTSANYGNGNDAKAEQLGTFSGNLVNDVQSALASSSKSQASQKVDGFEYMPVSHGTSTYNQHVDLVFSTNAIEKNGKQATAQVDVQAGEHYRQSQSSSADSSTTKAQNDFDIIGIASTFGSVKDKSGKEAKAESSFIGAYHDEQSASIDKLNVKSSQGLSGAGYFTGASTSANYGNGNDAKAEQLGTFSGNLVNDVQSALASSSKSQASQKVDDLEHMSVTYWTGPHNVLVDATFSTYANEKNGKQAIAQVDVSYGERYKQSQSSSADSSTAKAQNGFDIIGVASAFGSAKDKNGREAKTGIGFIGAFSEEQYASLSKTALKASHSLVGVGYLTGISTLVNGGIDKGAIAEQTGEFSGNVIKNEQSASIANSKSKASQEVNQEYMPVSYQGADFTVSELTFGSLVQYGKKGKSVADDKTGIYGKIQVKESVSVP